MKMEPNRQGDEMAEGHEFILSTTMPALSPVAATKRLMQPKGKRGIRAGIDAPRQDGRQSPGIGDRWGFVRMGPERTCRPGTDSAPDAGEPAE